MFGATTEFLRRTIWHDNEAASGGALYNVGTVQLNSNGFFRGNKATVRRDVAERGLGPEALGHECVDARCA